MDGAAATTAAAKCVLSHVSKSFGGRPAVSDVSLSVAEGEFVVILGPSGCGKTTALRTVAGLEQPDAGTVSIGGVVVSGPGRFVRPEHRSVGMVFQSYAIWPHMTVFENVVFPLRVRGVRMAERRDRAARVLDLVGLGGAGPRPATALSGGQMQRVALARALVADPALLLFDEPLSNLDLKLREKLRAELKELQRRTGITSLYVTHDQAEAVELADRIVVMQDGAVVQQGRPEELYRAPNSRFVAAFISAANILPGSMGKRPGRVLLAPGLEVDAQNAAPPPPGTPVHVVIHPEDCALDPTGLPAEVRGRRFQGTAARYTLDVAGLLLDVLVLGTDDPLPLGSRTGVSIRRAWIVT